MPLPQAALLRSRILQYNFFLERVCTARGILIYSFNNNNKRIYFLQYFPENQGSLFVRSCSFVYCPCLQVGPVFAQSVTHRKKYSHVERTKHRITGGRPSPFFHVVRTGAHCRRSQHCPGVLAPFSSSPHSAVNQRIFKQISGMTLTKTVNER